MSAALDAAIANHIDLVTYGIDDLSQLIKGRAAAIQLAATVIRYHNGICSDLHRFFCVGDGHNALQAEGLTPSLAHLGSRVPIHGLIKHGRKVVRHRNTDVGPFWNVVLQVRQLKGLTHQIVPGPGGVGGKAQQAGGCQFGRRREARPQITLAVAAHDRIHGECKRIEVRLPTTINHAPGEGLVLVIIKLEYFWRANGAPDLLDPDGGQRRNTKKRIEPLCSTSHRALTVMMKQTL